MSPHGINSLVGDLVEMAKATERLPQLEQELHEAKHQEQTLLGKLNLMSADLEQSRNYAASLEQKVRSLEVERDDASFRVLEAEDQVRITLDRAGTIKASVEAMIRELDPPKPEPVKEPEPNKFDDGGPYNEPQGQGVLDPTDHGVGSTIDHAPASSGSVSEAVHSLEDITSGQSESSPTVNTGETQVSAGQSPVEQKAVGSNSVEQEGGVVEPTKGPYSGKLYHDHPAYVSYWDWIDGGGTADSYNWRPTPPIASGSY